MIFNVSRETRKYIKMMKSQLDTSMYTRSRGGRGNIGDLVGAVRGIVDISNTVKSRRTLAQEQNDIKYLNTVYGKHFQGWDGNNEDEAISRNNSAVNEILTARPDLYSKVKPIIDESAKMKREAEDREIELAGKRIENASNRLKFKTAEMEFIGNLFANVETQQDYDNAVMHYQSSGGSRKFPSYQVFSQNQGRFYSEIVAEKVRNDQALEKINLRKQEADAKKAEKDVEWYDRKAAAEIGQKNRSGTGGFGGSGGGGADTMGLDPLDYIAASEFAVRTYGKRRGAAMTPVIVAARKKGITYDQMDDYLRFSRQSEAFKGAAREGMQQIYAGKSGKATEAAFDAFDDLLEKGDKRAISNYLKKSARGSVGVEKGSEILGIEGTLSLLNEIKGDLIKLEAEGINTNIFSGTAENVRKKLGYVKNPEMRKIAEKIQTAIMKHRNDVSGKAFSIPESAEYKGLFPSITNTGELNSIKISALEDVFNNKLKNFYVNTMGENAYNEFIVGEQPTAPSQSNQPANPNRFKVRIKGAQ